MCQTGRICEEMYKEHIEATTNKSRSNYADHLVNEIDSYSNLEND